MKRLCLILSLLVAFNLSRAQYTGGNNDGSSLSSVANQNLLPNIYTGGNDDGSARSFVSNQNPLPNIYTGGNDDGSSKSSVANQNLLPNIYTGGNDDGSARSFVSNQNPLPNIYTGGNDDGSSKSSVANLNPLPNIYTGGNDDGSSKSSVANLNPLPNIYTGGNDDGSSKSSVANLNPLPNIYTGGNDDGSSNSSVVNLNPLPDIYHGGSDDGFTHSSVTNQNPQPFAITCPDDIEVDCIEQVPCPANITEFLALPGASITGFCSSNLTYSCNTILASGNNCTGVMTRTHTVTDDCGNSTSCTQTITVDDNTNPTATNPVAVNVQCIANIPAANVNVVIDEADNCSTPNVTLQNETNNGGTGCPGNPYIVTRTYRVTDACGNFIDVTHTLTALDNINPTATNPLAVNVQCIANIPAVNPNVVTDEADNCSTPTVTLQNETNNGGTGCTGSPYIVTRTYRVTDACGNFIDVIHTLTALDNTNPEIAGCKTSTSRPLDLNETNYTVQGNEFDITATDNCSLASLGYNLSGATSGNGTTLSNVNLLQGATTITWTVTDACGNTQTCTFTVTVDKRPTIIVYTGDNDEQYSDHTNLSAELRDQSTNTVLANKTISFVIGSQNTTTVTDGSGVASTTMHIYQNVGDYDVTASFASDDTYEASSTTEDYDILKENASVDYTGPEFVSVPCTTCASTTILLSALINDISSAVPPGDPYPGDIRKARIKFVDLNTMTNLSGWLTPGLVNPADTTRGLATYLWTISLPTTGYDTYSIAVIADCNSTGMGNYTGNTQTVINVSRSSLTEFITGGGHIIPNASAGSYASDAGKKLNFGFNVKWNKSLKNLLGKVNIIFRRGTEVYQIKSTSMTSLSINSTNPCSKKAIFISKANLQNVTDPNVIPGSVLSNLTLQLDLVDNGEPGTNNDRIGISLFNGNTLVYSSNTPYNVTLPLNGGNIVVHNGVNCNNAATLKTKANYEVEVIPGTAENLTVKAFPNPTENNFTLQVMSNSNETVEITIYDISGKLLKKMNGNIRQSFRFGNEWKVGSYVAVIRQGKQQKAIKLVKQ